jgi:hypothetical protein
MPRAAQGGTEQGSGAEKMAKTVQTFESESQQEL